jgi:hypothetical protein
MLIQFHLNRRPKCAPVSFNRRHPTRPFCRLPYREMSDIYPLREFEGVSLANHAEASRRRLAAGRNIVVAAAAEGVETGNTGHCGRSSSKNYSREADVRWLG